jgi:predicted alpha/beta-hydrolase family hydrolase
VNPETVIILAHGAGQGMASPFMSFFHKALETRGLKCVLFNFDYMEQKRKMPDPQPKLQARYRSVVADVIEKYHPKRLFIGGKSMGGRVASYIASDLPNLNCLIFLGYPLHPPGKPEQLRDSHLYELTIPMLFISGTKDTFARKELLEKVVTKIGSNATLSWVQGGDHSLKRTRNDLDSLKTAVETIEDWLAHF